MTFFMLPILHKITPNVYLEDRRKIMKLNIYENKKIINTYEADTYDLMFGTVEDLIEIVNLDQLKSGDDVEIIKLVGKTVINGMDVIKPLVKDIFEGLTDEELRNVKVSEIASVLVDVIKFAIAQMSKGANLKN